MNDERMQLDRHDQILMGLAMNLQATAMVQLGKMSNPTTGNTELDLEGARYSIDILEALKQKCSGNLSPAVHSMLEHMVMDLQLNYTDEAAKGGTAETDEPDAQDDEDRPDSDPSASGQTGAAENAAESDDA